MNKLKGISILSMLSLLFVFSGCNLFSGSPETDKPAEEVLQEGLSNLYYGVNSAKYDVTLKGDFTAGEGEWAQTLKFDVNLGGEMDQKNLKEPKLNLVMKGSGSLNAGAEKIAEAEMRMNKDFIYFMLSKLEGTEDLGLPQEMVTAYVGKWWKMPIPAGTFDVVPEMNKDVTTMTEEEKKIYDKVMGAKLFKDVKYISTETVMGDSCYQYSGSLDHVALQSLIVDLGTEIAGEGPSEAELKDLEEGLKMFNLTGNFCVGKDDMIMRSMEGKLTLDTPEGKGTFELKAQLGNINKDFTVSEPADAEEFDPYAGMDMNTDMDVDMESYEDYSFDEEVVY